MNMSLLTHAIQCTTVEWQTNVTLVSTVNTDHLLENNLIIHDFMAVTRSTKLVICENVHLYIIL